MVPMFRNLFGWWNVAERRKKNIRKSTVLLCSAVLGMQACTFAGIFPQVQLTRNVHLRVNQQERLILHIEIFAEIDRGRFRLVEDAIGVRDFVS